MVSLGSSEDTDASKAKARLNNEAANLLVSLKYQIIITASFITACSGLAFVRFIQAVAQ